MEKMTPPIRIICCVTNDLNYDQRMIRICSSLQEGGYEVALIGRKKRSSRPLEKQIFAQQRIVCPFERGFLFYAVFNLQLCWKLLWSPADIICAVDTDTLLAAYLAARVRKKKLVYDAHEYFTEVPELVNRPLVRSIWSTLAAWIVPRVDMAYTVGPALAGIFENTYRKPFAVIRNLPRSESRVAERPAPVDPPVLLYQGMLNEGRGLEAILAALPLLPSDIHLWLAGEGDRSEQLRAQAAAAGLNDRVHFLGLLAPEELRKITPHAKIGLNLLENKGLNYYYSLANKAFDYIQAGVPSIQMQFPEYEHLQKRWGVFWLIPDLSPTTLAGAIQQLIEDPRQWQQIRNNCRIAAQELCWEKEVPRLLSLYRELSR